MDGTVQVPLGVFNGSPVSVERFRVLFCPVVALRDEIVRLGRPLLLKKSLYGDTVANIAWDNCQSEWLMSKEIGFTRLMTDGSIYVKRDGDDFIAVLNAVDDQLYLVSQRSCSTESTWSYDKAIRHCQDIFSGWLSLSIRVITDAGTPELR